MPDFKFSLPDDFDEYAWEVELKGHFEHEADIGDETFRFSIYDPVRLSQEIESTFSSGSVFFCENIIVVPLVNRKNIETAVKFFISTRLDLPHKIR